MQVSVLPVAFQSTFHSSNLKTYIDLQIVELFWSPLCSRGRGDFIRLVLSKNRDYHPLTFPQTGFRQTYLAGTSH